MSNLYVLSLSNNYLTGVIPTEIGDLGYLQSLDLHHNQLEGEIPDSIMNLINMRDDNLLLYENCNLYSENDSVQLYIQDKGQTMGEVDAYQYILDTNRNTCSKSIIPIIIYLLD